ncbi:hypothetical protein PPTG_25033 [Phytophthora nicotianae INRA-310]|uniref:Uncharacterized protein n=1 Tax=Phytophthora nicotianae (strain INRA-310) TaxID=761204 RepID=W2P8S4_PHYN3|nr:hypothetical protein PPTG_25033 [Phytophthora nicotianae INRA-310]ETM97236.1 hypothetical protein PPTG_25033 [Phytophthora nicotianae INRA-310]
MNQTDYPILLAVLLGHTKSLDGERRDDRRR